MESTFYKLTSLHIHTQLSLKRETQEELGDIEEASTEG
jgi:hypothetical protein